MGPVLRSIINSLWMGIGLEHQPPHPGAEFGTKDPFARIGEQHLLDLLADMPHRYVTEARTGALSPARAPFLPYTPASKRVR